VFFKKRGAFLEMSHFNRIDSLETIKKDKKSRCAVFESLRQFNLRGFAIFTLSFILLIFFQSELFSSSLIQTRAVQQFSDLQARTQFAAINPEELIRFHVVANSDSDEDQALKRAVRDAILEEVSPRLAASQSLNESREILTGLQPKMEEISKKVIESWGKTYTVKSDYGNFIFPTKSYGSLILPAGEYEAVRILIGEAKGSNWWCVLFPPLCFVDIEHSTAVPVDGKPGIPYDEKNKKPKVRFWIVDWLKNILG
jgi:stage II sporulation protein R